MAFWQWISLRISQLIWKARGNTAGVILGPPAEGIIKVQDPLPVPAVGEMANRSAVSLGEAIFKVFTPVKWILFGVSAVFILWAVLGRRR